MKKILCFIFGHNAYTYNRGTDTDPEQAWACSYCGKELEYGDEHWGLNLNWRVTEFFTKKYKTELNENDLPF